MAVRQVVFRPQAVDEALEAQAWYESRRAGLGNAFGSAVDALIGRIASNPLLYHCVHLDTRRAVLSRFPYAVYFRATNDQVVRTGDPWPTTSVSLADAILRYRLQTTYTDAAQQPALPTSLADGSRRE